MVVLGLAVGTAGTLRAITPTVAVTHVKGGIRWYELRQVSQVAMMTLLEMPPETEDAEVLAVFARELEKFSRQYDWRIRIGDAPGEVELQKLPSGKWRVLFYGTYGQATSMIGDEIALGEGLK